jgi:hypothetical protein
MEMYYLRLLEKLKRHRARILPLDLDPDRNGSNNNEELWRRIDFQGRFEAGLLWILEANLRAADIQLLSSKTAQGLEQALRELLKFLNGKANREFDPEDLNIPVAQIHFTSSAAYPRLERIFSLLDRCLGPFQISGTTNR